MSDEVWRPIPGWPWYEVSDKGNVCSVERTVLCSDGRLMRRKRLILKPGRNPKGYLFVNLYRAAKEKTPVTISRLVLEEFVGPRPDGTECRHLDGSQENNALTNLMWGTKLENADDKRRHGTHNNTRKTHCPKKHRYDEIHTSRPPSRPTERRCRTCVAENRKQVSA